jgi:hypothetical protein
MPNRDSILWVLLFTKNPVILQNALMECFELFEREFFPYKYETETGPFNDDMWEMTRRMMEKTCDGDLGLARFAILGMIYISYNVRARIRPFCDQDYFPIFLGILDKFLSTFIGTDTILKTLNVTFSSPNRIIQRIQECYISGQTIIHK